MALTSTGASLQVQGNWSLEKSNTPFDAARQASNLSATMTADVTTPVFTQVYVTSFSIANTGAGITTLDLYGSLTNLAGETFSAKTKLGGFLLTSSGTAATAQMRVAPGSSNPLSLGLSGTTPKITVPAGGFIAIGWTNDSPLTISNTAKTVDIDNPGSTSITIYVFALLG